MDDKEKNENQDSSAHHKWIHGHDDTGRRSGVLNETREKSEPVIKDEDVSPPPPPPSNE